MNQIKRYSPAYATSILNKFVYTAMEQDAQWISEIKKEDKQAFRAVYNHYADKILCVLRFHLTEEVAKEMVQSAFLTLWEKRESLKEHLFLNAFLLTITKNKVLNLKKLKAIELTGMQSYINSRQSPQVLLMIISLFLKWRSISTVYRFFACPPHTDFSLEQKRRIEE